MLVRGHPHACHGWGWLQGGQPQQKIGGLSHEHRPRQSDNMIDMDDGIEFAEIYPWHNQNYSEAKATAIAG
ncbi:MAG: hypothetical protein ORN98_06890 [Alphaproteobacteria bacterium]|nr:hypothetical protein [Alphaproteobacteria bacterium]